MTKEVQAYVNFWNKKKVQLEREIATKKRTLEQVNDKLSDPEFHLGKELKRGAVKVSKALGIEPEKKPKTVLIKKNETVPGQPVAAGSDPLDTDSKNENSKSGWSFFG